MENPNIFQLKVGRKGKKKKKKKRVVPIGGPQGIRCTELRHSELPLSILLSRYRLSLTASFHIASDHARFSLPTTRLYQVRFHAGFHNQLFRTYMRGTVPYSN